jgi:hypothetical protein
MFQLVSIIVSISLINISLPFQKQYDFSFNNNQSYSYADTIFDDQYQSYAYNTAVVIPANKEYQIELQIQAQKVAQQLALEQEQEQLAQLAIKLANRTKKLNQPTPTPSKSSLASKPPQPTNYSSDYALSRVYYWSGVYGINPQLTEYIAYCESGMRPTASGARGKYLGIFQQHRDYFPARAARIGIPKANPFNPDHNAHVSLSMMSSEGAVKSNWPSCGTKALARFSYR